MSLRKASKPSRFSLDVTSMGTSSGRASWRRSTATCLFCWLPGELVGLREHHGEGKPRLHKEVDHVQVELLRLMTDVYQADHQREVAILVEIALDQLRPTALLGFRYACVAIAGQVDENGRLRLRRS